MIIGRKQEQQELLAAYRAEYSKFIAVYGRRRVGKTYLIRETFDYSFTFQHTGMARGKMKDQLLSFRESIHKVAGKRYNQFKNWHEAFFALEEWLELLPEVKKVIFLDELPWMDTPKSNLEWCGFIRKYNCLGKQSKDAIYQLMDNFTLFYFQYMKGKSQIDLLIDRKDNVINLCEMKFSEQEYLMTEREATNLRRRKGNIIEATQTRKAVHITLVTPYGAKPNAHTAIIQNQITLDELFIIAH